MRNLSRVAILFLLLFSFPVKSASAEYPLIVEVQIAGEKSTQDFIKIYNPLNQDLDISGYKLRKRASTGSESSIRVFPSGSKILAKSYFLWANSKDDYHLEIGANVWSTETLAKNNSIALFNPEGIMLDALTWGESQNPFVEGLAFLENPIANQKLERKQISGVYQDTNNNSQDFYLNPSSELVLPETEILPPEETQTQPEPQPEIEEPKIEPKPITYPSGIVINEILPSPTGPDETEEWIEIFSQNNFEVDLSLWQIVDTAGTTKTYTFPKGTIIGSQGFLVLSRPTTKITLNNDGDGLNLIQPDGKIIDSVIYEKAPRGQSYNRTESGWVWSTTLTPGSVNIIPTPSPEIKEKESPKAGVKEPPKEEITEPKKELAAIGEQIPKEKLFLPFLIALIIAIFSGVIILVIKTKLKRLYNKNI